MRKELYLAMVIYFVTVSVLFMVVYRFLENWNLTEFTFFIAGILVLLVMIGWGYVLTSLIFAPKKQLEDTLTTLTKDILHELNIPLSTIKANTSMLTKKMTDEKSLKRLKRIDDASVRLEKLYNELVYAIHKEMHTIEKEKFDMSILIQERIAIFEEQKRNPFVLELIPYFIKVDKIGFEQMFDNIISNAMKYSSKESQISVILTENTLYIKDKGIGMTPTELLRLHERYYQANEEKEGKGIGLDLVKRYCENEDIDIKIHSIKDEGTEVVLDISKVTQNIFV